jgi:hypothetical protein
MKGRFEGPDRREQTTSKPGFFRDRAEYRMGTEGLGSNGELL